MKKLVGTVAPLLLTLSVGCWGYGNKNADKSPQQRGRAAEVVQPYDTQQGAGVQGDAQPGSATVGGGADVGAGAQAGGKQLSNQQIIVKGRAEEAAAAAPWQTATLNPPPLPLVTRVGEARAHLPLRGRPARVSPSGNKG